jgi:hypothetical protein
VPSVELTANAVEKIDALIESHGLPADTLARVLGSLEPLEHFPLAGRPDVSPRHRRSRESPLDLALEPNPSSRGDLVKKGSGVSSPPSAWALGRR